jgi:hypothetical protein
MAVGSSLSTPSAATEAYQCLVVCLAGRSLGRPVGGEAEWRLLIALAQAEGVGPLLCRALRDRPDIAVPAAARRALFRICHESACRSLTQEAVRARLCRRLAERGIPGLLLKGAALAFTHYDDPVLRPMADLDLLVPPGQLEQAARCLEESGCRPFSAEPVALSVRRSRPHLVYEDARTGEVVELHWQLRLLGHMRTEATAEIWSNAQPFVSAASGTGEVTAQMMRPGHAIPLHCAHLVLQHQYARLLWLFDLHQMLRVLDPAEASLTREVATRWRLVPATMLTLRRVQTLFGTPLPGDLSAWVETEAGDHSLQARLAAWVLAPDAPELPHRDLMRLFLERDPSSLLRTLFPSPNELRERLRLAPDESVTAAYVARLAHRLRRGPAHLRQLWQLWRAGRSV